MNDPILITTFYLGKEQGEVILVFHHPKLLCITEDDCVHDSTLAHIFYAIPLRTKMYYSLS